MLKVVVPFDVVEVGPGDVVTIASMDVIALIFAIVPFFFAGRSEYFLCVFIFAGRLYGFSRRFTGRGAIDGGGNAIKVVKEATPARPVPDSARPVAMGVVLLDFGFTLLLLFFVVYVFNGFSRDFGAFKTCNVFRFTNVKYNYYFVGTGNFRRFARRAVALMGTFNGLFT